MFKKKSSFIDYLINWANLNNLIIYSKIIKKSPLWQSGKTAQKEADFRYFLHQKDALESIA